MEAGLVSSAGQAPAGISTPIASQLCVCQGGWMAQYGKLLSMVCVCAWICAYVQMHVGIHASHHKLSAFDRSENTTN